MDNPDDDPLMETKNILQVIAAINIGVILLFPLYGDTLLHKMDTPDQEGVETMLGLLYWFVIVPGALVALLRFIGRKWS